MRSLGRQTLPVLFAERLIEDMSSGMWTTTLRGYRTLCEHYEVSQKTCKATLAILEKRKIILPAEIGKRRIICKKNIKKEKPQMCLLVIEDLLKRSIGEDAVILEKLTNYWLRRGGASGRGSSPTLQKT